MSAPEPTRRACPACGDSTRLYRDVEQVWNPATGEWEFAGTMGKADCSTCDWSGTEDETEGPLCQGCGKPEAACSENPCAAVAADRGDGQAALIAQLVEALEPFAARETVQECVQKDAKSGDPIWAMTPEQRVEEIGRRAKQKDAEIIAARTALAAARGEG